MKKKLSHALSCVGFCWVILFAASALGADSRCDELWAAANIDDMKRIADLVNAGADVNCRSSQGAQTALMAAAGSGKIGAVKFLISLGANPNVKDISGKNALGLTRSLEKSFAQNPNFAAMARAQREVIAFLQPRTEKGPASGETDLNVRAADPNLIAKAKLEAVNAAIMAGQNARAMELLAEVRDMGGLSPRYRAKTDTLAAEVGFRIQSWQVVKAAAERALATHAADPDDEERCKDLLKNLRKIKPELFK